MRRGTIELDGLYYGRPGFWIYNVTYPKFLEARLLAFDAHIEKNGRFEISLR